MAFMQDIPVTDVAAQEKSWQNMWKLVLNQMSLLGEVLTIMEDVMVGAVANYTNISQGRRSVLTVLQMDAQPISLVTKKKYEQILAITRPNYSICGINSYGYNCSR